MLRGAEHGHGGLRGSRLERHRQRRRCGGLALAAELGVQLTGGQAAGEEGGERSLLSVA